MDLRGRAPITCGFTRPIGFTEEAQSQDRRNTHYAEPAPAREKLIFENVSKANKGPLPDGELRHVYERIIDVMRNIQKIEIQPKVASAGGTEFDIEVND